MNRPSPHILYSILQKHQCSCSMFLVDHLEATLALLVFAGAFSCSLQCSTLQGLLILSPSPWKQPGIDRIMGLNDCLGLRSKKGSKTHPVEMSQLESVSISTSVFDSVVFVSDKSGCLSSFRSLSNEPFPPETSALVALTNLSLTSYIKYK